MKFFNVKSPKHFFLMALYVGVLLWTGWFLWQDADRGQNTATRGTDATDSQPEVSGQNVAPKNSPPPRFGVVTDVVDGVTVVIDNLYKVRYLGVTVPTTKDRVECFGREALQANESMVGKTVRLSEDAVLLQAKDGAWIRYVWVPEDEEAEEAYKKASNGDIVLGFTEPNIITSPAAGSPVPSANQAADGADVPKAGADNGEGQARNPRLKTDDTTAAEIDNGLNGEGGTQKEEAEAARIKEYMVSERIIEMGLGFPLLVKEMAYYDRLAAAARYSSATKRGLWGTCEISQGDNGLLKVRTDETCNIKGITVSNGDKVYRTSACSGYTDTVVLLYKGGKWLCSEEEAMGSGYVKAADCKPPHPSF